MSTINPIEQAMEVVQEYPSELKDQLISELLFLLAPQTRNTVCSRIINEKPVLDMAEKLMRRSFYQAYDR